jgi:hypothetical protein
MTLSIYRSTCVHAAEARQDFLPRPVSLENSLDLPFSVAIYIAVDWLDAVDYVGSTCRRRDRRALRSRIREHLAHPERLEAWRKLWVIPLKPMTPRAEVLAIEGMVGEHLRPRSNKRLPRVA